MRFYTRIRRPFNRAWLVLPLVAVVFFPGAAYAADAREIDVSVDVALEQFMKEVDGAGKFLDSAKGYIKREIGRRVKLRYVPEIIFMHDLTLETSDRMEKLFSMIKARDQEEGAE